MPIFGLQSSLVRDANATLASAFLTRQSELIYPKLSGSVTSTRLVEPFTIYGAFPLTRRYKGVVSAETLKSWKLQVPNLLHKSVADVSRFDMEFDQANGLRQLVARGGESMMYSPDYAFATRLKSGHLAASCTETGDDGIVYNTTFEAGVPYFSAAHNFTGTNQSNIVTGNLPTTAAAIIAMDVAAVAQLILRDFSAVVQQFQSFTNDKGALIYPSFDPKKDLVALVPPVLADAFRLAFQSPNAILGGTGGTSGGSGSTSNYSRIKDVISFAQLATAADVLSSLPGATTAPTATTAYYYMHVNDVVKPMYIQTYRPKNASEIPGASEAKVPAEYSPEGVAKALVAKGYSVPAADLYASAIVDHNLGAVGASATRDVVESEQFFVSPRMRYNFVYGPWFTSIKVAPVGQSL